MEFLCPSASWILLFLFSALIGCSFLLTDFWVFLENFFFLNWLQRVSYAISFFLLFFFRGVLKITVVFDRKATEVPWSWGFLEFGSFSGYWFNSLSFYRLLNFLFLGWILAIFAFHGICPFYQLYDFLVFIMSFFYFCKICSNSPL